MALSTCSFMVGHCAAGFVSGTLCDRFGRRRSMLYAVLISTVGVVLQSAAQNIAMFIVGRIVTGFGVGILAGTAPAYLAESVPYRLRAVTLGLFFNFWYVGKNRSTSVVYVPSNDS
jgi:MFS family permease